MNILVFGKNGQVAKALQLEPVPEGSLTALGRDDADLLVRGNAEAAIRERKPDIVINAAAYTAVDKAEEEIDAAKALNTDAPAEMAKAAHDIGAQFIHLSTDYVFDGTSHDRLTEEAPTNPLNKYGATKLVGETQVMAAHPKAVILRTSWVFSSFGNNFVKTMLRLAKDRDALSIVADQIGGPTEAGDIARAALAIAAKKHRGAPGSGIYHFQGTPPVSWAEFAEAIFETAKVTMSVSPIPTAEYKTPAARPLNTVLDCARIERDFGVAQPDWRSGLVRVVKELQSKESKS
ncbi:dTDP-4-dehydrorhamnose reductase [Hyphococcus formosus]|uniref:dTDP-4-dehydrorhamnose reductase n=1 Tax=Hyphococcus formosus TaxID=3143534 RepID=UPI00398B7010